MERVLSLCILREPLLKCLGLWLASASSSRTGRGSVRVSVRVSIGVKVRVINRDRVKGLCELQGQSETVSM